MTSKYKISDVAKVIGISSELIRHYERIGILTPKRSENRYRTYTTRDVNILFGTRKLIGMGYSLETVEFLINSASLYDVSFSLQLLEEKVKNEIRWKQLVLDVIKKQQEEFKMLYHADNKFTIKNSPAVYRIHCQNQTILSIEEATTSNVNIWIEKMPVVRISPEFTIESIYNNLEEYNFGFIVEEYLAEELNLINTPGIKLIPSQLCLTTIINSADDDHIKPSMMQEAVKYMENNRMKMCSNAWGNTIGTYVENGITLKYHEIYIPIEYKQ